MRFLWRSLTGLLLTALTVGLMALAVHTVIAAVRDSLAGDGGGPPPRERVFAVSAIEVSPETVTPVIETFGKILSRRTLELRASAAGEVVWLSDDFEEGASVSAGDLLAKIDDRDALGNRDTAEADLAEAEAELRDAERALDLAQAELEAAEAQAELRERALARQRDLQSRGVGTDLLVEEAELAASAANQAVLSNRQALADAEARIDFAGIALDRRRIALDEAERRVADTEIYAGFTGRLANVDVALGGLVSANEALGELIDPDALEAAFRVSATQYARLVDENGRLGPAPVSITLDVGDLGLVATGRLHRESAAVGEGQTGRLLFARLDAPAGFRPGDFVTVRIEEPPLDEVAVLPAAALNAAQEVLVIGPDDRLEPVEAQLLRRQGDDVVVAAGDLAGREVVAERSPFLGGGIKVRRVQPEPAPDVETEIEDDLVELDADRRARLVAFVEANDLMPADDKARVLSQLRQPMVSAQMIDRIEARMGG
jgi:multidrug efflux pump subunit AcrA (membrane-fusion protein)